MGETPLGSPQKTNSSSTGREGQKHCWHSADSLVLFLYCMARYSVSSGSWMWKQQPTPKSCSAPVTSMAKSCEISSRHHSQIPVQLQWAPQKCFVHVQYPGDMGQQWAKIHCTSTSWFYISYREILLFAWFYISNLELCNINLQKSNKLFHLGNDLENSAVLQRTTVPNSEMKFIKCKRKGFNSALAENLFSDLSLEKILVVLAWGTKFLILRNFAELSLFFLTKNSKQLCSWTIWKTYEVLGHWCC